MTKKADQAAAMNIRLRSAYLNKVATLLGHVSRRLSHDVVMAAFDGNVSAEQYAASVAALEPVGRAVHPLKVRAVQAANSAAHAYADQVRQEVQAANWDLNAAPYPSRVLAYGSHAWNIAKAKHDRFKRFTTRGALYPKPGEPDLCVWNDEAVLRYVDNSENDAAAQYDAFICKLVAKVGPVVTVSLEGDHVWSYSILTVTREDGSWQRWKTQQIWNTSVNGAQFQQWPTRLLT